MSIQLEMRYLFSCGALFIIMAFMSCKVYYPQPAPVPLISAKHELQLNGGITLPPGLTGSVAYSPVSHLAVQVHGFLGPVGSDYWQGMVGYYWQNVQNLNFEVYGGLAGGKGKAMNVIGGPSLTGDYSICFTQFNFGQTRFGSRKMDYGIGLKAGILNVNITDNGYYEQNGLDPVLYSNQYFLIEPMAFLRLGDKRLRTSFQVNGTSLINTIENQKQIPFHTLVFGISFTYLLSKENINEK